MVSIFLSTPRDKKHLLKLTTTGCIQSKQKHLRKNMHPQCGETHLHTYIYNYVCEFPCSLPGSLCNPIGWFHSLGKLTGQVYPSQNYMLASVSKHPFLCVLECGCPVLEGSFTHCLTPHAFTVLVSAPTFPFRIRHNHTLHFYTCK